MRLLATLTLLMIALPASPLVHARQQGDIRRCVDAQGHQVFTDRSCASMQATPALPAANHPSVPGAVAPALSSRAPQLCAGNVADLRQQIVDAFAVRDPNRIAGLTLWGGYGESGVVAGIRALAELMQHPLLDIRGADPAPAASAPPDLYDASRPLTQILASSDNPQAPTGNDQLTVVTGAGDGSGGTRDTTFGLTRQSGCVWLLPAR